MRIFTKLWKNFLYSLAGLRATLRRDLAFRLEMIAFVGLMPVPFIVTELSMAQKTIMLVTLMIPMVIELLNSAIEALCNIITTQYHNDIKFIKDAASAAVLVAVIIMLFTWGLNLWPVFF